MPAPVRGHSGGGGRRRRGAPAHEEEGGSERWLVTYADMLTLLLVLFIVLYSVSVVNTSKYISLKSSLSAAFGSGTQGILPGGSGLEQNAASGDGQQLVMPGAPIAPANGTQPSAATNNSAAGIKSPAGVDKSGYNNAQIQSELAALKAVKKAIAASLTRQGMQAAVRFAINSRGLVITVVTNALIFPGNSATLLSEGQKILAVVAVPLAHQTRSVEVDGFTNQDNVSTGPKYPSGWELSSARASSVVRYLASHGVAEKRLKAVGFSDQQPLYPITDPRAQTLNRRVEIVVISSLPAEAGVALQSAATTN